MDATRQSWNEAMTEIVVDFMEAAVHTLLHARRVYPQDIFERRRKYGVPVWMSRHPDLNHYIFQVLLQAKSLMVDGVVRKVYVCFFDEGGHADRTPVERIAIDITIDRESDGRADEGSDEGRTGRRRDEDRSLDQTTLQEVEDQLRSALLQIEKSSAHLPTRQGCTFALHLQAHEENRLEGRAHLEDDEGPSAVRSALRGGKWLLADNNEQSLIADPGRRQLVPIKSVRGPGLRLDLSTEMGDCPRI
ncbi:unnamed protein product [Laminaria digitata]